MVGLLVEVEVVLLSPNLNGPVRQYLEVSHRSRPGVTCGCSTRATVKLRLTNDASTNQILHLLSPRPGLRQARCLEESFVMTVKL